MTSVSSVEQEVGTWAQDEVAVTDRALMGSSSRWERKRRLCWVIQLSWRKPHQRNGIRFSIFVNRLNGGHRRRDTGLIWNLASRGNLRNWSSSLLFPTLLLISFLLPSLSLILLPSVNEEKQMRVS